MTRREFSKNALITLTGITFLDTLFKQQLFASSIKTIADHWLKELHTMCLDLKTNSISCLQWQNKIDDSHSKLPLEDLIKIIDFENSIAKFEYPELGVVVTDPNLPKVDDVSDNYSFIGRIFGMQKDRQ